MKYDKLVRDLIPNIIAQSGNMAICRVIDDNEEFKYYLEKKLDEEVAEFHGSKSIEEIADIFEVLSALIEAYGYDPNDVVMKRRMKSARRGKFDKKLVLTQVIGEEGRNV